MCEKKGGHPTPGGKTKGGAGGGGGYDRKRQTTGKYLLKHNHSHKSAYQCPNGRENQRQGETKVHPKHRLYLLGSEMRKGDEKAPVQGRTLLVNFPSKK